jgi:NADPH-dependent stearoyl-CoA 9-desaturase
LMSGNLCYQIEHHLYPDLPSNRYAQIAQRVQALCAKYDLPYTTGPLVYQYLLTLRTIIKLALPDRFLAATSDDAPETASEDRFDSLMTRPGLGAPTPPHVDADWPPRSATARTGSTNDTHQRAAESARVLDDSHRH